MPAMSIVIFEDAGWRNLLPLVWMRGVFELCCGCDRLIDKQRAALPGPLVRLIVRPELRAVVAARNPLEAPRGKARDDAPVVLVNGRALITGSIQPPVLGSGWTIGGALVAATISAAALAALEDATLLDATRAAEWMRSLRLDRPPADVRLIDYPWQPALFNAAELSRQLHALTGAGSTRRRTGGRSRSTARSPVRGVAGRSPAARRAAARPGVHQVNERAIHLDPTAVIKPGVVLDAEGGPIAIARGATIQPNAVVEGPCYVGPGAIVRPAAVIRAGTTIGPVCRVGGEVEGSILHGWCNKQHSGFLGHSYVCPWVNLGADTVTSDLKNTYGTIRVALNGRPMESGERFIGTVFGDHAKTGIGTLLPTGCIIGVAANVFTQAGVPGFVPSFSWLTRAGMEPFRVDKAIEIARTVQGRRSVEWTADDEALFRLTARAARDVESWDD